MTHNPIFLRENLSLISLRIAQISSDFEDILRISKIYTGKLDSDFAIAATRHLVQAEHEARDLVQGKYQEGENFLNTVFTPTLRLFVKTVCRCVRGGGRVDFLVMEEFVRKICIQGTMLVKGNHEMNSTSHLDHEVVPFPTFKENPNHRPSSVSHTQKPIKILTEKKQFFNNSRVPEIPEKIPEITWTCHFCKWLNPEKNIKCIMCGKLHPQAEVRGTPHAPRLSSKEWWPCYGCTYEENSIYLTNCIICGAPRRSTFGEASLLANSENIPLSKGQHRSTIKSMAYLVKPRTIIHKDSALVPTSTRTDRAGKQLG